MQLELQSLSKREPCARQSISRPVPASLPSTRRSCFLVSARRKEPSEPRSTGRMGSRRNSKGCLLTTGSKSKKAPGHLQPNPSQQRPRLTRKRDHHRCWSHCHPRLKHGSLNPSELPSFPCPILLEKCGNSSLCGAALCFLTSGRHRRNSALTS